MDFSTLADTMAPLTGVGQLLLKHPVLVTASVASLGAAWVYWKRENLNVVRNFWAVLEDEDGQKWFRFYSEPDAYLWNLFPNDPIMRWRLRAAARSRKPLTVAHTDIDYIPWSPAVSRLESLLRGHVSSVPLQWYGHMVRTFGSAARPHSILLAEQYPNGADMTWRNVLLHPAMLVELRKLNGMTPDELRATIKVDSDNHYDLLFRLIRLANILKVRDGDSIHVAAARKRINMSTIRVPGSEAARGLKAAAPALKVAN